MYYTLNEQGVPVIEPDLTKFMWWFKETDLHVCDETIGNARISTVFLCIDHSYSDGVEPVLWKTMVFGGNMDKEQDRCSGSREQALAMHTRMVEKIKMAERNTENGKLTKAEIALLKRLSKRKKPGKKNG